MIASRGCRGLATVWMAGAVLLLTPAPVHAATANCVAVVVDAGSRVSARCLPWRSGLTGAAALTGTGHSYRLAASGLICAIDGFPADCHVDSTHYWSYWHKAPGGGSWTYSSEGAGTYNPRSGSTEGWAYQNGSSRQPRNISFDTICPPPAPTPRPSRTLASPKPPDPPAQASGAAGTTGAQPPTTGPTHAAGPAASAAPAATASVTATATAAPGSPGAPAARLRTAAHSSRPPLMPVVLAVAGLVAAAGLGTAAWRRTRKAG